MAGDRFGRAGLAAGLSCLLVLAGAWALVGSALAFDPGLEARNFAKTTERDSQIVKTPAYQLLLRQKEVENNLENAEIQLTDPERLPYGNVCWNRNRECAGDVRFYDWPDAGFGIRKPVLFTARSGATISGNVWATKDGPAKRPAIVITTGSVQAPETLYWGTAAALAKHGYVVLTYDVQGQGRSDTFGVGPDLAEGVPSQAGQPFFDGTEDALDFLLSTPDSKYEPRASCGNAAAGVGTSHADKQDRRVAAGFNAAYNPLHDLVDPGRVGIAGHSLGAAAVSYIGQLDDRVDAIVAWDNLDDVSKPVTGPVGGHSDCPSGSSPRPETVPLTKPALGFTNDYGITPAPNTGDPDPAEASEGERGYEAAGIDSMQVVIRGGTHEEYAFIAGETVPVLGLATYRGMDLQTWYSVAWMDRYVGCEKPRCRADAERRLLSNRWRNDDAGEAVDANGDANLFSFYSPSRYSLTKVNGERAVCEDMRKGCPSMRADGLPLGYFQITDAYTPASGDGGGPRCAIEIRGTNGRDTPATVPGSGSGDRLIGLGGGDRLRGLAGDDCLLGGAANDRLNGGSGDDRLLGSQDDDRLIGGSGRDKLIGGTGNDSFRTVDGERDTVSCGPGTDQAEVDRRDRVNGCERVRRMKR